MGDEYIQKTQARVLEDLIEQMGAEKGRVYVNSPDEVPEEYEVQEGQQGGYYYETEGGNVTSPAEGSGESEQEGVPDGGDDEELSDFIEQWGPDPGAYLDEVGWYADTAEEAVDVVEEQIIGDLTDAALNDEYFDGDISEDDVREVYEDMYGDSVEEEINEFWDEHYADDTSSEGESSPLDEQLAGGHTHRDVARGIAQDFADEFDTGGAYQGRDADWLQDRVFEEVRDYAADQDWEADTKDEFIQTAMAALMEEVPEAGNYAPREGDEYQ